jgi:hypothetical protein
MVLRTLPIVIRSKPRVPYVLPYRYRFLGTFFWRHAQ